jgi:hypothetical protein
MDLVGLSRRIQELVDEFVYGRPGVWISDISAVWKCTKLIVHEFGRLGVEV